MGAGRGNQMRGEHSLGQMKIHRGSKKRQRVFTDAWKLLPALVGNVKPRQGATETTTETLRREHGRTRTDSTKKKRMEEEDLV